MSNDAVQGKNVVTAITSAREGTYHGLRYRSPATASIGCCLIEDEHAQQFVAVLTSSALISFHRDTGLKVSTTHYSLAA